jgi:phosphoglycerate dehydrogenase-like enzyme
MEDANVKSSRTQWQSTIPFGLKDRTLGIIGVGRLGIKTANVGVDLELASRKLY